MTFSSAAVTQQLWHITVQEFDLILFCAFRVTGYVYAAILIAAKCIY